jgi:hypothetical protein
LGSRLPKPQIDGHGFAAQRFYIDQMRASTDNMALNCRVVPALPYMHDFAHPDCAIDQNSEKKNRFGLGYWSS